MNKNQTILVAVTISIVALLVGVSLMQMVPNDGDQGKIQVVATFYPLAYFAEEIGGEHVSVKTLIPPGTEVHTWHPSTSDILAADKADILVYNGAGLEPWFEENILPSIKLEGKEIVDTTQGLELFENEESALEHLLHEIDLILHGWEDGDMTAEEALGAIEGLIHEYMEHSQDESDHENVDEHDHEYEANELMEEIDLILHGWEDGDMTAEEALGAIEGL
ncbi:MAG: metal ABC transporter substrate-binding protein, partial [Candidatus Thermoplasmatota archaeon]|nr:metal ABC transporter substrate-binding protein [Candidatus Thermoplasmatota archaeon]